MFKTVLVTTIPARPYFWLKSGEHDVTDVIYNQPIRALENSFWSGFVKLMKEEVCIVWWRCLLSFFRVGRKVEGAVSPRPLIGARVNVFLSHTKFRRAPRGQTCMNSHSM